MVAVGLAALVALALGPVLAGTASAAPIQTASASPTTPWAYGGTGSSNGTVTNGLTTITWHATFGWTVIYTATDTGPTTTMLEEQRTVGISISVGLASPNVTGSYSYVASENDTAFLNLTNASTVYVNGHAVPALGVNNESLSIEANVQEALHVTAFGKSHSAFFNATGVAQGTVGFTPSLGLIPLNLTGVTQWNSSALASPHASWVVSYAWADFGWNGSAGSGSSSFTGNWTGNVEVYVNGYLVPVHHVFADHMVRFGVYLDVQGPVDAFDGFILVPHDFDLFGAGVHPYASDMLGSASVGYGQGQELFLSPTPRGPMVTAAETSFAASAVPSGGGAMLGQPTTGSSAAAASGASPSAAVYGEPMSVAQAQALNSQLTGGQGSGAAASGFFGAALIALAVVAGVAVFTWRSYARRRSPIRPADGSGERGTSGGPPAGASSLPAPNVPDPSVLQGTRPPQV